MNINLIISIVAVIIIIIIFYLVITKKNTNTLPIEHFTDESLQNVASYIINGYMVPPGAIIAWYGTKENIPKGYVLCDGNTYGNVKTPDLRDRFIMGGGGSIGLNTQGGNKEIKLSIDQIPAHTHNGRTDDSGINPGCTKHKGNGQFLVGDPRNDGDCGNTNHGHNFTTSSVGGGQPINILPPYNTILYIMKLPN